MVPSSSKCTFSSALGFHLALICWRWFILLIRASSIHSFQFQHSNNYDHSTDYYFLSLRQGFASKSIIAIKEIPLVGKNPSKIHHVINNISSLQHHLSLYLITPSFLPPQDAETNFNINEQFSLQSLTKFEKDEVVRVIDANTVKLKRNGLITFAAVQTPSGYNAQNFHFPDCMTKSPSSKLRQLLPEKTKVIVKFTDSEGGSRPRAALVEVEKSKVLINSELVREGFAKSITRGRLQAEEILPGISKELSQLQDEAKRQGLGIFKICNDIDIASDDQFEPMDRTTEIQWDEDGGKVTVIDNTKMTPSSSIPLKNPGDTRKCSDFKTYEDALRWYETYFPFYGDVAKLDRDGDGVPCSGLPHTQDKARYRIKKPLL